MLQEVKQSITKYEESYEQSLCVHTSAHNLTLLHDKKHDKKLN
jgi:hypothetical protein